MSNYVNFLITILYGGTLIRVALKIDQDLLIGDCAEYPMEPENRKYLQKLLPLHVQSCGEIVEVTTELFEIVIID